MNPEASYIAPHEVLMEEFFQASYMPVNNHEEWLLRVCAQLMEREAYTVSVIGDKTGNCTEARGPVNRGRRRRKEWTSSTNSGASIPPSTGTPLETSAES